MSADLPELIMLGFPTYISWQQDNIRNNLQMSLKVIKNRDKQVEKHNLHVRVTVSQALLYVSPSVVAA